MNTVIVVKVSDKSCENCKHMSRHDRAVLEGFPEVSFQEVELDDVINYDSDFTKFRIYQCLEKYALNKDYTVDLPTYVFLTEGGQYLGHHVGVATITEFREKAREILGQNSKTGGP